MPIGPGSRVGPYEVTSLLGQGGMGRVWRARHLALKRDDALKVLPDAFAADPARMARFQREAEILASLSHPNIAQVHGLEQIDRSSALVLELIEGPTLAERIVAGPLTLDESLSIARQVAAALDAAHEQGIVHRDLKPANVKVRPDGTVKLLDFGLAKAFDAARLAGAPPPTESLSEDPALGTAPGIIVGTPNYMSPEQARGGTVDARADVWAFGCVLYEMLTGRRAFDGGSGSDTLAAVLTRDPEWTRLPATVPPQVHTLLRRCLVRDPRQRLKHISTALFALENADSPLTSTESTPARTWTRSWIVAMTLVAATSAAVAAGAMWWLRPQPGVPDVVQTIIPADTSISGTDVNFAFMPDGRLVYVSSDTRRILVRPMNALEPVPILTTASWLRGIFPSPDGRWLAFFENAFTLEKVPAAGGPAARIVQTDGPSRGAAWGPDDAIVFATANLETGLQRVPAAGGSATVLTRPDAAGGELDHVQPVWLPDGRGVLFTVLTKGGVGGSRVAVLERGATTWRTLIEGGYGARYVSSGHLVYTGTSALWAVRFDLSRLAVEGAPVEVLANAPVSEVGVSDFDVAANGTLAFPRGGLDRSASTVPAWVDRSGRETPLPVTPGAFRHPRLSPDGRRLAVSLNADIFVWDVNRPWTTASRLTFSPGADWFPVWTPDGRRIVFGSWRGGRFSNLYIQNQDGGEAERLTDSPDMQNPTSVAPDGSFVVFHSFTERLEALRLDGRGDRQVTLVETPLEERNGVVSPDGRWLAYESESPTRPGFIDVFVRPFPDTNRGMWQVTSSGGTYPAWSRDGRELFYLTYDGTMTAVPVEAAGDTWRNGEPVALFRGPYLYHGDGSIGRHYDVAPDGRRVLMLKTTVESDPYFVVIQNWTGQLERLTDAR
jgi:serine/threonine-protein kinase